MIKNLNREIIKAFHRGWLLSSCSPPTKSHCNRSKLSHTALAQSRSIKKRANNHLWSHRKWIIVSDGIQGRSNGRICIWSRLIVHFVLNSFWIVVAGVAGIEFLFDQLASHLSKLGCDPNNDRIRCYLLDEVSDHGALQFPEKYCLLLIP